jgi:hypothetical protein
MYYKNAFFFFLRKSLMKRNYLQKSDRFVTHSATVALNRRLINELNFLKCVSRLRMILREDILTMHST